MLLSPSILTCDFSRLGDAVSLVETAGADRLHLDVMDGVFVPNLTFGAPVIRSLRPLTALPFDIHLMMQFPHRLMEDFLAVGDSITFHVESEAPLPALLETIRTAGKQAGLSLKPATSLDAILPYLPLLDQVLVMTVEPGFGGQSFREDMLPKIADLRKEIDARGLATEIVVDGGVNRQNAPQLAAAGVDVAVVGNAFLSDSCPKELVSFLHRL